MPLPLCRESLEPHATVLTNLLASSGVTGSGLGGATLLNDELAFNALKNLNSALEFAGLTPQVLVPLAWVNGPLNAQGIKPAANAVLNALEALRSNPANFTPPAVPIGSFWWWDLTSCNPGVPPGFLSAVHSAMDQSGHPAPKMPEFEMAVELWRDLRETRRKVSVLGGLPGVGRVVKEYEAPAPAAKREEYAKLRIEAARKGAELDEMKIKLGF